jgi:hypothetical protein
MEPLRKPTEEVSWEQVKEAVPDEAAVFEAALAEANIDIEHFCIWWEDDCPEEVRDAWERLSQQFKSATDLELWPYDERSSDGDVGFLVVGAWQLSPAGQKFLEIEDVQTGSVGKHAVEAPRPETSRRRCDVGWDEQVYCIRLDPDDDLVETILIEQNSSLLDQDDWSHVLPIRISMASGRLRVAARGYGNGDMADGYGRPVCIEVYDGELRIRVFPDILNECPVTLSLERAKEERRARKVTIQGRRATAEGQAKTVGTVAVPDGTTDEEIKRLFWEWQDLVTGDTSVPDEGDEDDASGPCEAAADSEFVEWLVEKHGFRHAKEPGEVLTLLW